jgi:Holliday junction DNA helicase RuvB
MVIKSSNPSPETERVIAPTEREGDSVNENILRPRHIDEYIGQESIKQHLRILVDSATIRKEPLEHILFYGPPGLGKTTLSMILAAEMHAHMKHTSGPAIEKQADLVSILTSLQTGDILFIDEIHRLRPQIEEILYAAMEDFSVDIMVGSGTGATSVKMDIPHFTLVGATTKLSKLSAPLRDRFGNILKLDFYEPDDLSQIAARSLQILKCARVSPDIARFIALKSRGTPRIVNRYVKILRDYQTVGFDIENLPIVEKIFSDLGIDEHGLDMLDRKLLQSLASHFGNKPVGLSTLASLIGEEESTIEDVVEPYLLKL